MEQLLRCGYRKNLVTESQTRQYHTEFGPDSITSTDMVQSRSPYFEKAESAGLVYGRRDDHDLIRVLQRTTRDVTGVDRLLREYRRLQLPGPPH